MKFEKKNGMSDECTFEIEKKGKRKRKEMEWRVLFEWHAVERREGGVDLILKLKSKSKGVEQQQQIAIGEKQEVEWCGSSCTLSLLPTSLPLLPTEISNRFKLIKFGESFWLGKFPLVARSGKIRKLVADAKNASLSKLELPNFPGGPEAFELAAKFCYGLNFEITTTNVAPLRCAAEYLEMTEDYREENLVERTETYLTQVVCQSLDKSVEVLSACESLLPLADEIGIPDACISAIARNACREQLVSGLSRLDCNSGSLELKDRCLEWVSGSLKYGIPQANPSIGENGQKAIVESLVTLLPTEKSSCIPLNFLFGMTRVAIMVDATLACRLELERRIAYRLEMALLDDLLIPSLQTGDSLFDVDTIHRILVHSCNGWKRKKRMKECGYESQGMGSPSHGSLLKVGRLVDAYLAEIAPDPYLSLPKLIAMIAYYYT
ncbi:UNVERIFIED_CONTAM: BTB/POZ domain-containing protein [Sesamum latifolium]|uniref:BTB/POZ domain-containing protein n=1 Tax=Sesamum latifolium TaxID=2727402 RepID=A0AAW2XAA2_9LAMI